MGLKSSCLLARMIFKIFDVTETKKINFRTWVTTLSALSEEATVDEKIAFSFGLYDQNGDGRIDIHELRGLLEAAIRESGVPLSEAEVKNWCDHTLSQVDADGNGTVEYSEYRDMVRHSKKFLQSFTLDVKRLCGSFRFKRASHSALSTDEEQRRKELFRQHQKHPVLSHDDLQKQAGQNGATTRIAEGEEEVQPILHPEELNVSLA